MKGDREKKGSGKKRKRKRRLNFDCFVNSGL